MKNVSILSQEDLNNYNVSVLNEDEQNETNGGIDPITGTLIVAAVYVVIRFFEGFFKKPCPCATESIAPEPIEDDSF